MDFLPMPHLVTYGTGVFRVKPSTHITLENTEPAALLYAQLLRDAMADSAGIRLPIVRGASECGDIVLTQTSELAADTYHLDVGESGVRIAGGSDEAVLHGAMTLRQWAIRHGAALPYLHVEDHPDLAHRGYYLDCSRGRVPTLATLKRYADLLCRYKVNEWQLYIEHTYLFRHLSEAWREDTPLTAEEIMELDAYCRARHIELVPSLSSFGHMYQILTTRTCAEFCELEGAQDVPFSYSYAGEHHTLNVSNPRAMDFVKSLITEYRALFTSDKFNICCDETFDLGRGKSAALAAERTTHRLYLDHVVELCRWLLEQGVTPMFWGDMLWRHPESYAEIPKGVICLNWGYLPNQRENEIRDLAQMGATQYACPGVCTWKFFIPLLQNSFSNNRAMCGHAHKYGAIGMLNTDWGDMGHVCHPWFSVPGILYGAAFAWNASETSFEELNRAISRLEYGDTSETLMDGFAALSDNEKFDWFTAVHYAEDEGAQAKSRTFSDRDTDAMLTANQNIDAALAMLDQSALTMDAGKRDILHALHVSAEGVKLWNDIGRFIAGAIEGWDVSHHNGKELAEALENWRRLYVDEWRSVSKESTLVRTSKIVFWYADLLRTANS